MSKYVTSANVIGIYVTDIDEAKRFYIDLLGLEQTEIRLQSSRY